MFWNWVSIPQAVSWQALNSLGPCRHPKFYPEALFYPGRILFPSLFPVASRENVGEHKLSKTPPEGYLLTKLFYAAFSRGFFAVKPSFSLFPRFTKAPTHSEAAFGDFPTH
jgi:hypothetical protein